MLASVGSNLYATSEDGLWVHLFTGSEAQIEVGGERVMAGQETDYSWDGAVRFHIALASQQAAPMLFTLHLRLPGWCDSYTLKVNSQPYDAQKDLGGYPAIRRAWQSGALRPIAG